MIQNNKTPSTTFSNPQAELTGKVEHLLLLTQNQVYAEALEQDLMERAFDIMVNASDEQISNGKIKGDDQLTSILNGLLKISKNSQGGYRQLTPEVVEEYNKNLRIKCNLISFGNDKYVISGDALLRTLSKAVSYEVSERFPTGLTKINSAKQLFHGHDQTHTN